MKSNVMTYEKTPVRIKQYGRTNLRKSLNKESFDKMKLSDANDWQLFKRFVIKHETALTYLLALAIGVMIGLTI